MIRILKFSLIASVCLFASCCRSHEAVVTDVNTISSPGGVTALTFQLTENGTPQYVLEYQGTKVVYPSNLGFELRGAVKATTIEYEPDGTVNKVEDAPASSLHDGFVLEGVDTTSFSERWSPVWGEEDTIDNTYRELLVKLVQKETGRKMNVRFRLYDDGLGFRYEFPENQALNYFVIKEELTQFAMGEDLTAWWIPGDYDTQEYEYTKCRLSEISSNFEKAVCGNSSQSMWSKNGVQTSLQLKSDAGLYINIHEAALVDYPCMHLELNPQTFTFTSHLTPDAQGWKGYMQTPCHTPWRTVQVAPSATGMLASRLILNLNEPCAYDDVSWIHPVKYIGVWWEMISGKGSWAYTDEFPSVKLGVTDYANAKPNGRHSANNENVRRYIDFAAEHGFDQVLVEGWNIGWEDWANCSKDYVFDFVTPYPDFDIAALNAYAHSKGVKIMMHHETSSSVRNYERHMEAAYNLMDKYGYDAVKSGYVGDILPRGEHHYGQWMVNHYLYAVTEAAKHHIMVNGHEAVRPTGLCRTYPNLIGNESARGTEYQAFGGTQPDHVTILPFTRFNGGPMDFTPGIFEMDLNEVTGGRNNSKVNATIANQLGLYVVLYSPLQMAADFPEHYEKHMDAFEFIKNVEVDWSRSEYLLAEPGDYVVTARKGKKTGKWFIGGVTDENSRTLDVPLYFLDKGCTYIANVYADDTDTDYQTNPKAYNHYCQIVTSEDVLTVNLARGGGFAVELIVKE